MGTKGGWMKGQRESHTRLPPGGMPEPLRIWLLGGFRVTVGSREVGAEAEGMEITFEVGDAEEMTYADGSFDVVLSTIGVMFCPDQESAASELLRVCRSGGKIGLASWTPDGYTGQMLKTVGKHVPPPGIKPPSLWGTEERLQELLGDGVSSLQATRRTYTFRYPSAEHFVAWFRDYYGPTVRAFAALDGAGQGALARDLHALLEDYNTSGDETLVVPSAYLEVVAIKS